MGTKQLLPILGCVILHYSLDERKRVQFLALTGAMTPPPPALRARMVTRETKDQLVLREIEGRPDHLGRQEGQEKR